MKPDEVADLLAYISDSVPNGAYGQRALEGFYDGLHDLPADMVLEATKAVIRRKPFKPAVSEIRDEVYVMSGIRDGDAEWDEIMTVVRKGPPWPIPPVENPVAAAALQSIGGLPMLRLTERPELARKDFLKAYEQMRGRELGQPILSMPMLGASRGAAGELAGEGKALGAGEESRKRVRKPDPEGWKYE